MFIDSIIDAILRPFREIARVFNQASATKSGVVMDVQRVKSAPALVKNEIAGAATPMLNVGSGFGQAPGQPQFVQPSPQAAPLTQKKKMSFWPWSKKICIRCSQKLHKTWDQCPYCGQGQNAPLLPANPPPAAPAPPPKPAGPARTIAMDAAAIDAPILGATDRGENIAWLVPLDGMLTGELLQIKGRSIIGTAEASDIRLTDASISSRHAEVTLGQNNRFRITDLGSRNGTYVNDKTVASVELIDGDNIRLGRTTFRFKTKQ